MTAPRTARSSAQRVRVMTTQSGGNSQGSGGNKPSVLPNIINRNHPGIRVISTQGSKSQIAGAQTKLSEKPKTDMGWVAMDGNEAAAYVAYAMSEISFIYPISPATSMGEHMDKWAASGKKNVLGQCVDVNMMQSEGGAAGALHGAAAAGTLSSTFTASQGLLLMIPNMYLLAGELMPTVLHVSARTISKHALSIFNDHSDVMACRQTGFAFLSSCTVQEVMDLALVSHIATLKSRIPFLHFFDGYRTSAEVSKIKPIQYEDMAKIFPTECAEKNLRAFALNPNSPMIRGTGQRPDIFFQTSVAANKYYDMAPAVVEEAMKDVESITGRKYDLFNYHGSPTAERVVVIMGSAAKTMEETVDYLNSKGENVGVINVHLFRPWSPKHFLAACPPTVKKVAVMDKTREDGAVGMPLYLDVNVTFSDAGLQKLITGAQYGLASKEFTPEMAKAVFDNLNAADPKKKYVVGIEDDVTNTSLAYGEPISTVPEGTKQVMFWGLGSDGTVGASKTAIKTIGLNTELFAQGHFVFDSHKADGVTTSHVRFGPSPIKSEYGINKNADYISCAHPSYVYKYDMLTPLRKGGIFVLNSPWNTIEEMEKKLPTQFKSQIAQKEALFYNISANKLAQDIGLGKRINMLMQSAFYQLSGVLPIDRAMELLKNDIQKQYSHKGPKVIEMNFRAVEEAVKNLKRIDYPKSWSNIEGKEGRYGDQERPDFVRDIMDPVLALEGDKLPVSSFEPGGYQPTSTTKYEKRGIAPNIPVWVPDKCTQCNYCAIVCPHAVVRPFMLDKKETREAPSGFEARKAKGGAEAAGLNYTIQISPMDCTGCEVCVESCPDDALYMAPYNEVADAQRPHWDYASALPDKGEIGDKYSVKGSQFLTPLLEFSGACAGCGETPYLKLATQLFGDRMVIANASGCSSVWGGTSTTIPFTTKSDGKGPAWGRSLFEDNAEYGFGMAVATKQRRHRLKDMVNEAVASCQMDGQLKAAFQNWNKFFDDPDKCDVESEKIITLLKALGKNMPAQLKTIYDNKDMLRTQSHWIVGGDGWAYDIGFGGLDHVISQGENVNILVLDTEMYSNTGGQVSKATSLSTVTKFATSGKRQNKKDLGMSAMMYEDVYVSSVALGANMSQCVSAFKEAEEYPGTSIIIAYSPCIDWGIDMKDMMSEQKQAVESGYWTLYRYDPRRRMDGNNPFQLDSRKLKSEMRDFLVHQNRFQQLMRKDKITADQLHEALGNMAHYRHDKFKRLSMDDYELLEFLKGKVGEATSSEKSLILYGSETGNAQNQAGIMQQELKRRGIRAQCMAMDDFDFEDLPAFANVYCMVATCGQGEFPGNCQSFWKSLQDPSLPSDLLTNTKFAVFGLGDSSYVFYNEAAKQVDERMAQLGANRILGLGLGDDKDEERFETGWNDWIPNLWNELGTPPPPKELLEPNYSVYIDDTGAIPAPTDRLVPAGTRLVPLYKNVLLTPPDYDRDIRHYEFDLSTSGFNYNLGDCLGIYAHNDPELVGEFLNFYGMGPETVINLEDTHGLKDPLPGIVSAKQLFTEVLDIFGRPNRRFYEMLEIAATDEAEKKELEFILTKEGQSMYQENIKETTHYADLLKKYPSAKVKLDTLVDYVPRIKPRLYSIASSSEMHPGTLELCIVKDDWTTPSGKLRNGLCTRYLTDLGLGKEPDLVASRINAAGINIPDDHRAPFVMVGLGTGLAPFRAFIEDREVAKTRGETVGPMALFFGARYKRTDFTYGDELEDYNARGTLTLLSNAFSRDQEHKIYVQNRIAEHPEIIYDYLHKKKGFFYLCGPAGNVPPAVRKAVVDSFVSVGGHSPEEAEKLVTDMQIEGRYNVEAW